MIIEINKHKEGGATIKCGERLLWIQDMERVTLKQVVDFLDSNKATE